MRSSFASATLRWRPLVVQQSQMDDAYRRVATQYYSKHSFVSTKLPIMTGPFCHSLTTKKLSSASVTSWAFGPNVPTTSPRSVNSNLVVALKTRSELRSGPRSGSSHFAGLVRDVYCGLVSDLGLSFLDPARCWV